MSEKVKTDQEKLDELSDKISKRILDDWEQRRLKRKEEKAKAAVEEKPKQEEALPEKQKEQKSSWFDL